MKKLFSLARGLYMKQLFRSFGLAVLLLAITAFWVPTGANAQVATFYTPNSTNQVATLPFGPEAVGSNSGTQAITLTNTGTATLSSIVLTFTQTNSYTGSASTEFSDTTSPVTNCGGSLTPGSSCTITLTFTPGGTGARSAWMWVASNASASPQSIALTGTGVVPGATQCTVAVGATVALTQAQSGCLVLVGATTGEVVTLPTPAPGLWFDFLVTVTNTSNYNEIETGSASIFLLGDAQHCATGIACLDFWANGTSTEAIKMDGAHLGGLIGSHFHVVSNSATVWSISGVDDCTATCSTGFTGTE